MLGDVTTNTRSLGRDSRLRAVELRKVRAQTDVARHPLVLASSEILSAPRFRQVLDGRTTPHRLRIQAHQVEELRWNIRPYRQTEALCRLICDRVVVRPGAFR